MKMLKKISMGPGEEIVAQYDGVRWKDNILGVGDGGQVTVTSQRIIFPQTDTHIFSKSDTTYYAYSLDEITDIHVVNMQKPSLGKRNAYLDHECQLTLQTRTIDVHIYDYDEFARFVNALHYETTGNDDDIVGPQQTVFSGIAGTLGTAKDEFARAFGVGKVAKPAAINTKPQKVSISCPGCGATLTGRKGKTVICEYCSTAWQL